MTGKSLDINHKPQRTALVVDDELSNRIILRSILKRFGYSVLEAKSGQEGVEIFSNHDLDVVFMDVLMPEMDGYDATINIKKLAGDRFVPVIFLTALTEEDALVRCIEVGGDDFLTKPFSHAILHSKLRALERIRSLHVEVDRLYGRMRLEEEIAKKVFNTAVLGNNVAMDLIPHRMQSAAIFSGDLLLTAWAPSGDLNVLLGDFTGHGLSAALGALPMAAVFRAMTDKGFAPERILATMNEELHNLLPAGMFLAATFVQIHRNLEYVQVFNSGLPDGFVIDQLGNIKQYLPASLVPLGILPWQDMLSGYQQVKIQPGWRVLLVSDGVTEAKSSIGSLFGQEGVEAAIKLAAGKSNLLETVGKAMDDFCIDIPQTDDISLVEIPCIPEVFANTTTQNTCELPMTHDLDAVHWQTSILLRGRPRLLRIDPVPILISQIRELEDNNFDNHRVFNLLTSIYDKAIDNYDAFLASKSTVAQTVTKSQDITINCREREQNLAALPEDAELHIKVVCEQLSNAKRLWVQVESPNWLHKIDGTILL